MNSIRPQDIPSLKWGLSTGFRDYIAALPDAAIECADGCVSSGPEFLFPQASISQDGNEFQFSGAVRFAGHHGMLDVEIREPAIRMAENRWILTVNEPGGRSGPAVRSPLVQLPDLTIVRNGNHVTGVCVRPELTFEGTYLFGNVYRTGHHMDTLLFTANTLTADTRSTL